MYVEKTLAARWEKVGDILTMLFIGAWKAPAHFIDGQNLLGQIFISLSGFAARYHNITSTSKWIVQCDPFPQSSITNSNKHRSTSGKTPSIQAVYQGHLIHSFLF